MLNKEDALAYNNRGLAYANQGKYKEAIEDFSMAIELYPEYTVAYNNRGRAYANQKKYEEAIEDYDRAIELDPEWPEAYNNRGLAYANQGKYKEAIEDFSMAIELYPEYAEAYYHRGIAYLEIKILNNPRENYLKDYNMAIKLNPEYVAEKRYETGVEYLKGEYWGLAVDEFDEAIELNPQNHIYYRDKAIAQTMNGLYESASETLKMGDKVEKDN